jgi:hypothetical protein
LSDWEVRPAHRQSDLLPTVAAIAMVIAALSCFLSTVKGGKA